MNGTFCQFDTASESVPAPIPITSLKAVGPLLSWSKAACIQ